MQRMLVVLSFSLMAIACSSSSPGQGVDSSVPPWYYAEQTTAKQCYTTEANLQCVKSNLCTKVEGDDCTMAHECKTTCCTCTTGSNAFNGSACENNKCASAARACELDLLYIGKEVCD